MGLASCTICPPFLLGGGGETGMDAKLLRDLARRYHENREFITNEEMTKQSLIVPFIIGLGYDPSNPREVRLEYTAEFTVNDGKRSPDRMDYAIFSMAAQVPILVIEAKPLGSDVRARSPQLARYMSQLPLLRFGIITDGCDYLFFSDLAQSNVMDDSPFFSFSLSDPKLDFDSVAKFLGKFSKDQFRTEKLVKDAQDSTYRQKMIDKLVRALQAPESDEEFVKWLSNGIYQGQRRQAVLERLGRIARESVQPAILRTISDDFLAQLRTRINEAAKPTDPAVQDLSTSPATSSETARKPPVDLTPKPRSSFAGLVAPASGSKPVRFWIGDRSWAVKYWRDLPVNTCTFLSETQADAFKRALTAEEFQGRKSRLLAPTSEGCRNPVAVTGGFVEVNLSAGSCVSLVERLLVFCSVDPGTAGYECQHKGTDEQDRGIGGPEGR